MVDFPLQESWILRGRREIEAQVRAHVESTYAANREWFIQELKGLGAPFQLDTGTSVWVNLLITLAPFVLLILKLIRMASIK